MKLHTFDYKDSIQAHIASSFVFVFRLKNHTKDSDLEGSFGNTSPSRYSELQVGKL